MSTALLTTNPATGVWVATWGALANAESGDAATLPVENATRSVQITGTFGAAGNVIMEGSNDAVTWFPLSDGLATKGNLATITANGLNALYENTRYVRPRVSAGDGTTNLKVVLVAV